MILITDDPQQEEPVDVDWEKINKWFNETIDSRNKDIPPVVILSRLYEDGGSNERRLQ